MHSTQVEPKRWSSPTSPGLSGAGGFDSFSTWTPTRQVWWAIAVGRIFMAIFMLKSSDSPDEWYQSIEIAYYFVFGRGEPTWEWQVGLRSFLYPIPFATAFWLLKVTGLDTPTMIFIAPRIISGLTCFGIDFATYQIAKKYLTPSVACSNAALFMSLTSWYTAFTGLRTLTNSLEGLALLLAFLPDSFHGFLFCAGMGCGLRATFALPMLPIAGYRIYQLVLDETERNATKHAEGDGAKRTAIRTVLMRTAVTTLGWLIFWIGAFAAVDYVFYRRFLITALAFIKFNVLEGKSALFGVNAWYWYLPCVPLIVGVQIIFAAGLKDAMNVSSRNPSGAFGVAKRHNDTVKLLLAVFAVLLSAYSMLPHKELRFIFPVVPVAHIVLSAAWVHNGVFWRWKNFFTNLILVNFLFGTYFGVISWQHGPISAMDHIRTMPLPNGATTSDHAVHILAGCHMTPSYSHAHGVVSDMVFLNCSMEFDADKKRLMLSHQLYWHHPLQTMEWLYEGNAPTAESLKEVASLREKYRSQGIFKNYMTQPNDTPDYVPDADVATTLRARLQPKSRAWPHRFVMFSRDSVWLENFLRRNGYSMEVSLPHAPHYTFWNYMPAAIEIWTRKDGNVGSAGGGVATDATVTTTLTRRTANSETAKTKKE